MLPPAFNAECKGVSAKKTLINPSTAILKHLSLTAPLTGPRLTDLVATLKHRQLLAALDLSEVGKVKE